jgi:hypothetical protein
MSAFGKRHMNPFLEHSPYADDDGQLIGRDPRKISAEVWRGTPGLVGMKAIRAKCIDCAHIPSEVRKCVQMDCPMWPLRMGTEPAGHKIARTGAAASRAACSGGSAPFDLDPKEKPAHEPDFDGERGA